MLLPNVLLGSFPFGSFSLEAYDVFESQPSTLLDEVSLS
jgi:hypothetical protein